MQASGTEDCFYRLAVSCQQPFHFSEVEEMRQRIMPFASIDSRLPEMEGNHLGILTVQSFPFRPLLLSLMVPRDAKQRGKADADFR